MGGPYVREAVGYSSAQTYDGWEIKIVCDGCDDALTELKSDPRIEVIHQKKSGASVARNTGFAASSGEWVTFLDHDDLMFPTKLESQVRAFEKDSTVGLCHTQFEQVDMEGHLLEVGHGADVQYEDLLQCKYSMVLSTVMFSREAFESAGGFDPKSQAEDIDLALKVLAIVSARIPAWCSPSVPPSQSKHLRRSVAAVSRGRLRPAWLPTLPRRARRAGFTGACGPGTNQ